MIRGLYTSGWGMMALNRNMDAISNNMANVDTNAYKRDITVNESFPHLLTQRLNDVKSAQSQTVGHMSLGFDVAEVHTDYTQGQLVKTDRNLDFAIRSTGEQGSVAFFTIEVGDRQGNTAQYYTRDGSFRLDEQNRLVTRDGNAVLGENGYIFLDGEDFITNPDGSIIQNGVFADRLLIREFTNAATLAKVGANLVTADAQAAPVEFVGEIVQGFLEKSNVNIINEMVNMITVMRSYEANQKALITQDEMLGKAVNELGVVG